MLGDNAKLVRARGYEWPSVVLARVLNEQDGNTNTHAHAHMHVHTSSGEEQHQTYTSFCKPPMYNFKMYQEVTIHGFIVQAPLD